MAISAISGNIDEYSYRSSAASSDTQKISELKEQEKKLQQELEKLQKSSSGSNSQQTKQQETQLQQKITRIEQQIQQLGNQEQTQSSSAGNTTAKPQTSAKVRNLPCWIKPSKRYL